MGVWQITLLFFTFMNISNSFHVTLLSRENKMSMWQKRISVSLPIHFLHPSSFLIATEDDKTRQNQVSNSSLTIFPQQSRPLQKALLCLATLSQSISMNTFLTRVRLTFRQGITLYIQSGKTVVYPFSLPCTSNPVFPCNHHIDVLLSEH